MKYWGVLLFVAVSAHAQIILSEIMFNPAGNERYDEFIELYNAGDDIVDLSGWLLSDGSKFSVIRAKDETAALYPQQYAVILVPVYFTDSRLYEAEIPSTALQLTITGSQFGAYGLKNSEGEPISLYLPDTTWVAAYTYSADNLDGESEEKIDLFQVDEASNWANSLKKGGTPGYENSVCRRAEDLALTSVSVQHEQINPEQFLWFQLTIQNMGTVSLDSCTISVEETYPQLQQLGTFSMFPLPAPGDSMIYSLQLSAFSPGDFVLHFSLFHPLDLNAFNNDVDLAFTLHPSYSRGAVIINEIMYDTDEKDQEWIELYNPSTIEVNLQGWSITDLRKKTVFAEEDLFIAPNAYALLANQMSDAFASVDQLLLCKLPDLNNSGDHLILFDSNEHIIDSLSYDAKMGGGRMISIERIDAQTPFFVEENWSACEDTSGSTPGKRNSVAPRDYDVKWDASVFTVVPRAPRCGESVSITGQLINSGLLPISGVVVELLLSRLDSLHWEKIQELPIHDLDADDAAMVTMDWSVRSAGAFLLQLNAVLIGDMRPANNALIDTLFVSPSTGTVVINEIMYSPAPEMCEWVELYNNSDQEVNMLDWTICDEDTSQRKRLSLSNITLGSKEFVVVGRDSTLHPDDSTRCVYIHNFPSLGNDDDCIALFDANGLLIERVCYSSAWGGRRGYSLERLQPSVDGNESSNWMTCVEKKGHTMGKSNSVYFTILPSNTNLGVSPNPFSPNGDGIDDAVAISYSLPGKSARVNLKIYDISGRMIRFLLNNEESGSQRTIFWDGCRDSGEHCRMGIYIIFLEALDESNRVVEHCRTTIVLAGFL